MKFLRIFFTTSLFLFTLVCNPFSYAYAGLSEGTDAYENGDYSKTFKEFKIAAKQGDVLGKYAMGVMFERGQGVKKNYFQAVKLYKKAARAGITDAQYNLGLMYFDGRGVRQSNSKAKEWFGKACDNQSQKGCEAYARLNTK